MSPMLFYIILQVENITAHSCSDMASFHSYLATSFDSDYWMVTLHTLLDNGV